MRIDQFRYADIDPFLAFAAEEGWISDRWELEFLLETFPGGCLVGRMGDMPVAFVTSIRHEASGWIGNLIVAQEERGKGYGSALIGEALLELQAAGARTVWLTASEAGKPIYEKMGFREIDVIKRWSGKGTGVASHGGAPADFQTMAVMDRMGWGDGRSVLLSAVAGRGNVFGSGDGFLVTQPCADGFQIGPWGGVGKDGAAALLDQGLAALGCGARVVLDVPVRNVAASSLLHGRGFVINGRNSLMYVGQAPDYVPEHIYALASMGSMG